MKRIILMLVLVLLLVGCSSKAFFEEKVINDDNGVLVVLENTNGMFITTFDKENKKTTQASFSNKSLDTDNIHVRADLKDKITRIFHKEENTFMEKCAIDTDTREAKKYTDCSTEDFALGIRLIESFDEIIKKSKMSEEEIFDRINELAEVEFNK